MLPADVPKRKTSFENPRKSMESDDFGIKMNQFKNL